MVKGSYQFSTTTYKHIYISQHQIDMVKRAILMLSSCKEANILWVVHIYMILTKVWLMWSAFLRSVPSGGCSSSVRLRTFYRPCRRGRVGAWKANRKIKQSFLSHIIVDGGFHGCFKYFRTYNEWDEHSCTSYQIVFASWKRKLHSSEIFINESKLGRGRGHYTHVDRRYNFTTFPLPAVH